MSKIVILVVVALVAASVSGFGADFKQVEVNRGRIIGGLPARAGQFPFVASIYKTTNLGRYFCGGSLILPQWILTAAQCVDNGVKFAINLGSNTLNSTDINRVSIEAEEFHLHPEYNNLTLENDIALIRLNEPVLLNDYIKPALLPTTELSLTTVAITVGWGQINDLDAGPVNQLQEVQVATVTNADCMLTYGNQITDTMVCAEGSYNEGTCIGDMGSPLVRYVLAGRRYELVGVASFLSQNGCETTDPSGFTRVFPFVDWIKELVTADNV